MSSQIYEKMNKQKKNWWIEFKLLVINFGK